MTEKSAVDIIYELYDLVKIQGEKIELLNKHLGLITNKVNGVLFPDPSMGLPKLKPAEQATGVPAASIVEPAKKVAAPQPRKNVRVFGTIEDSTGKRVSGASVEVTDANGTVVKKTKTNIQGLYAVFLPPGNYSAEYIVPGAKPEFRIFQVMEGQAELEIG